MLQNNFIVDAPRCLIICDAIEVDRLSILERLTELPEQVSSQSLSHDRILPLLHRLDPLHWIRHAVLFQYDGFPQFLTDLGVFFDVRVSPLVIYFPLVRVHMKSTKVYVRDGEVLGEIDALGSFIWVLICVLWCLVGWGEPSFVAKRYEMLWILGLDIFAYVCSPLSDDGGVAVFDAVVLWLVAYLPAEYSGRSLIAIDDEVDVSEVCGLRCIGGVKSLLIGVSVILHVSINAA